MSAGYFDFILNYKGKVARLSNIDPDRYCYFDLLADVSESVLSYMPPSVGVDISVFCELPGSGYRIELNSDTALLDLFKMDGIPTTLYLFVETTTAGDIVGIDEEELQPENEVHAQNLLLLNGLEGDVYGFSEEDKDWDIEMEGEIESDDGGSFSDEVYGEDDKGLSDYESGDDEGKLSSETDDDVEIRGVVDSSYFGNEPYLDLMGEVVLEENMIFEDVNAFSARLRDYTVEKGFKIVRDKNEKSRVTAHCAALNCPWRIHASPLFDGVTYKVKKLIPEHTCSRLNQNDDATSTWIAKKMLQDFKENPQLTLDGMQEKLNNRYGIEASRIQLYRAKRKCLDVLEGSHGDQYKLLPTYAQEVRKTNPGSLFKMQYNRPTITQNPIFMRLFISFEAMISGFLKGCRPYIWVDGCHLKGPYGCVLISAVALDGNNGLFPLAVAVVECENNESWGFFLDHIQTIIRASGIQRPWTIMSDWQKGLDNVVKEILPEATHRKCARHLFNNFKAKHPGLALRKQFWIAARAYNQRKFDQAMNAIKDISEEAHAYLSKLDSGSWARHAFNGRMRSDHITNNGAESFNNWLGNLRGKPILTMLEGIRCKLMSRIQTRYQKGVAWSHSIIANINKKLTKLQRASKGCAANYAGGTEYDVVDNGVRHLVDLGRMECVCMEWEISGIPCKHAMAAIVKDRKNPADFVHPYFSKDMYLKAHGGMIHPIVDQSMWTAVVADLLEPPPLKRLPRRPRKNRRRAADEAPAVTSESKRSQTVKCTWCKEFGHNKRTCQRGPIRGGGNPSHRGRGNRGIGMGNACSSGLDSGNDNGSGNGNGRGRGRSRRGHSRGRGHNNRGRGNNRSRRSANRGVNMSNNIVVNDGGSQPSQCVTQVTQGSDFALF